MVTQKTISLPPMPRGFHLVTRSIRDALGELPEAGIVHLLLQHTSAALTLNENADPSVRDDFRSFMDRLVPENLPEYTHVMEGSDDMPAHLKSSIFGTSLTVPVSGGRLNLGTWQGIYLCEFRNRGGKRRILATVIS